MGPCPWNFLTDNKKHIISLVGGGGKTTIMYELAAFFAQQGRRTLCMTTTHIWQPRVSMDRLANLSENDIPLPEPIYAKDFVQIEQLWQQGRYAVIGTVEEGSGKLIALGDELLQKALQACDIALIEADGSKQMPCKLPNEYEPVLLPGCDLVIAVAGLDALGKSLEEACFRWQQGRELFASSCNLLMDEAKLAQLLLSEQGSHKQVGSREFYIALNKCDLVTQEQAMAMKDLLIAQGMEPARIWLRNVKA
ncbi:MAG: selenium cofactor biosynthesis protein YqeC [Phascolarctobacterium sp.]